MSRYLCALSLLLFVALLVCSCQPVMPDVSPVIDAEVPTPEPVPTEPMITGPLDVLCLGDLELEHNWGVCAHLAGMVAAADPTIEITVDNIIRDWEEWSSDESWVNEGTFREFWETDEIVDRLGAGEWNWVVIYESLTDEAIEQKSSPEQYEEIESAYVEYGGKLASLIDQSGATAVLLVPWDHPTQTSVDVSRVPSQEELVGISQLLIGDSNAHIAPVGPAWKHSVKTHPTIQLYGFTDRFAPSIQGTYLSAAVVYATILGRNPVELNYRPTDILPDSGPASYFKEKWKMSDEEIAILQQIAWDTVQEFQAAGSASEDESSALEAEPSTLPELPGEVLIPAGTFQMGCDADKPRANCRDEELPLHTVYLDTFYIDKFEVTNAHYQACVDAGVCVAPKLVDSSTRDVYFGNLEFADYPVIYMDWSQAYNFCAWDGKRLPTEAEWIKAARGANDTRKYPWGDEAPTCDLANYWEGTDGCVGDTNAAGSYPAGASPYGVMDMAGNVMEWVSDWYADDYYSVSPTDNPAGPDIGKARVMLGRAWHDPNSALELWARTAEDPLGTYFGYGIRCAHTP